MKTIEINGLEKRIATGFSWKSLFFGCLYPAAKGDIKGFIIQLILAFCTMGMSWVITPFVYNRRYLERMIEKGWKIKK
jgi:hypothetical protein